MNRTGINGSGSGIRRLPRAAWPKPIRLAWDAAATTRRGRRRSPATYLSYDASVGVYLWFVQSRGLLDPDAPLAEQVTPERLDDYFGCLLGNGNSPYTIEGRFRHLRAALQMMHPGGEFGFVTRPDGIPLQQTMEMRRRVLFVPDSRHLVFWAEALFRDALALQAGIRRQLQVRDAAMIGIFAELAPRARAMQALRLGSHLLRNHEEWILRQDGSIMKDKRTVLELPLSPRVGTILDRYIAVERRELLQGRDHDALWVTSNGDMLGRSGLELMIARRSKARFGIGFGPHRFRTSLTTTRAVAGGKHPFDASLILCHSPTTSLRYYNRADGLEASRAHDERIAALEDGDNPALAPWRVSPAIQKSPIRQAVPLRKSAANRKAAT